MRILSRNALVLCPHGLGHVELTASQHFVRVAGTPVLVKGDPLGRSIARCPFKAPGTLPCLKTTSVDTGYSKLLFVAGRAVCLDSVRGTTSSTPPGIYSVQHAGQTFVESRA